MPSSRAVVVLGMHRSGTSVLTRGLQSLGVFLGDEFLSSRPDNPTGYWEDRVVFGLNERLLDLFGLNWESLSLISDAQWHGDGIQALRREAVGRIESYFAPHPLWGFKDPRTIRLLPFWRGVFRHLDVDDRYVVAIRNPISVAASLRKRQSTPVVTSHLMSLAYLVPNLHEIAERRFVVVDYDRLVAEPRRELERVRSALELPRNGTGGDKIDHFSTTFLDPSLRHDYSSPDDFDTIPYVSPLVREAYLRLYQLATDQMPTNSPAFWSAWNRLRVSVEALIRSRTAPPESVGRPQQDAVQETEASRSPAQAAEVGPSQSRYTTGKAGDQRFCFENRPAFDDTSVRLFVVIGAQCTGTNLLRGILNTNSHLAMLGEVLFPSPAPAHWENFLRVQAPGAFPSWEPRETEALLDRYLKYVLYRVRNHWLGGDKSRCRAVGVDIRYNQVRFLAPESWGSETTPFFLSYLKSRRAVLVHVTRRNAIDAAISALIATEADHWQSYDGVAAGQPIAVDPERCLEYARTNVRDGGVFLDEAKGWPIVEVCYEDLVQELARAAAGGVVPEGPGPLRDIAQALDVPFEFRCEGRIQEAINLPCSKMLLNKEELSAAVRQSEFSPLAHALS